MTSAHQSSRFLLTCRRAEIGGCVPKTCCARWRPAYFRALCATKHDGDRERWAQARNRLFGVTSEYEHAMQFLIEAKARFPGAYSEWLGLQDSSSDIVIRQFFAFLQRKDMDGHSRARDRNGGLVKYGSLISPNSPFDTAYPFVASKLRDIHQRRNKLPGSRPYDQKGGAKNKWLTKLERDSLVPKITSAVDAIARLVEQNR